MSDDPHVLVKERPPHLFKPGQSGNPTGRPKGAKGIANAISIATNGGQDLVDWCLLLWKDIDAPIEWRWKAFDWLTNRLAGGVPTHAVLQVGNVQNSMNLAQLSEDDLQMIDDAFRAANARIIDAKSSP